MKRMAIFALILSLGMSTACIELAQIISGVIVDQNGGPPPSGGGSNSNGDSNSALVPEVVLSVSNLSPLVNEEVVLTCRSADVAQPATSFAFQPASVLFGVNSIAGTASFIPSEVDVGTTFRFTCTGTNEHGIGPISTAALVIPVGLTDG